MTDRPRILFVDSYYPEVLRAHEPTVSGLGYGETLSRLLGLGFGTADFASDGMRAVGWEAEDLVANSEALRRAYAAGRGGRPLGPEEFVLSRARETDARVVAVQTVGVLSRDALLQLKEEGRTLALFASYELGPDAPLDLYDVLFTSFPHYEALYGPRVKVVYLPLAFGRRATEGLPDVRRDVDVSFVGGLGYRRIWNRAEAVFERLAADVSGFRWWGYGERNLAAGSALRRAWQGQAWGRDMYAVYRRSKIVVNRHGEIAAGYANNMRLYEATGSGALLVTEEAPNLATLFSPGLEVETYRAAEDLVGVVRKYLADPSALDRVSAAGRRATLSRHTFQDRARDIDRVLCPLLRRT